MTAVCRFDVRSIGAPKYPLAKSRFVWEASCRSTGMIDAANAGAGLADGETPLFASEAYDSG